MTEQATQAESSTDFKATDTQKRVLRAAQASHYKLGVSGICREVGINRDNWYQWLDIAGFIEWWNERRDRFWVSELSFLDAATWQAATEPTTPGVTMGSADRRLLYERYDKKFRPQTSQEIKGTLTHELILEDNKRQHELCQAALRRLSEIAKSESAGS